MKTRRATIEHADWRIPSRGILRGLLAAISAAALISTTVASIADDKKDATKPVDSETVLCLELPHPDRLLDRLTDPKIQEYLKLSQQFQKLAGGKQLTELRAVAGVVAGQLNTTWEEGLRDLTGGGIFAQVEIAPGQAPRFHVLITARKPELLQKTSDVFLKMARQDAEQKGKPDPAKTSTHRGATIVALGGDGGTIAYCIADGKILASNSVQNVERLIDRGIDLAARAGKPAPEGKADGALTALGDLPRWKALRDRQGPDALAWSFVDLARLRQIDPKRFGYANQPDTGITLLFGSWYEAFRKAPSATASISWSDTELAANIDLPQPKEGACSSTFKGTCQPRAKAAAAANPASRDDRLIEPVARLVVDLGVESRPVLARGGAGIRPARYLRRAVFRRSRVRPGRPRALSSRTGASWLPPRILNRSSPCPTSSSPGSHSSPNSNAPDSLIFALAEAAEGWPSRLLSGFPMSTRCRRKDLPSSWSPSRSTASRSRSRVTCSSQHHPRRLAHLARPAI